jgi:ubiquinone/menaquinone biosynthesis C-methylase UbiE
VPIDFHDPQNRHTYGARDADASWSAAARAQVDATGRDVVDIGCGAGVYARAWLELGAGRVTGVDFSTEMLAAAREEAGASERLRFVHGAADATGLPAACADVVFARALVHHLPSVEAFLLEARRLLRPGGTVLIQDRTIEDVCVPGSPDHPRGLILERFPRLVEIEAARRPGETELAEGLRRAGFGDVQVTKLVELRRSYPSPQPYVAEIRRRTGRSLLHDLDDRELAALADHLESVLPHDLPVHERDRWTLWSARDPDVARSLG